MREASSSQLGAGGRLGGWRGTEGPKAAGPTLAAQPPAPGEKVAALDAAAQGPGPQQGPPDGGKGKTAAQARPTPEPREPHIPPPASLADHLRPGVALASQQAGGRE